MNEQGNTTKKEVAPASNQFAAMPSQLWASAKQYGLAGLMVMLLAYSAPYVIEGWKVNRTENREDQVIAEATWERYAIRLETAMGKMSKELEQVTLRLYEVEAELRQSRAGDYSAPVAMWHLNRSGEIQWFNRAFEKLVLIPAKIDPETAYGRTWEKLFGAVIAAPYVADDDAVLKTKEPSNNTTLFTLTKEGNKRYWHTLKYPIVQDGRVKGLKGIAWPLDEE